MQKRQFRSYSIFLVLFLFCTDAMAQKPLWTFDLLKKDSTRPAKFKERKLGSEKMADKKFTTVRHFTQNTFTHYNYFFNANNKINAVIEQAKIAQKDDYTKLLSFYPFSLDNTASQKTELDSVIIKATAGILLHDLRNDWIDNMYLLMGKAYFLRKDFDTAIATFQFINYNLFPRKKHEDESRVVGTRDAAKNSSLSIANKEKQNILQQVASKPPSRNDALIWLSRSLIEQGEYSEAAGLINTLQVDPNLPTRLKNDLEEVNAYWFFKQEMYDSAAVHLERALSNADTKQDKSRSEFLLAQLYEMNKKYEKASGYYEDASQHTSSPLLDIHAQLNNAKMLKNSNPKELDNSLDNLLHMARKDKFESYRDILYYSAGELALQKPDTIAAIAHFNKSLKYNETNVVLKNKTFLHLADINYDRKDYKQAYNNYDSLQTGDTSLSEEKLAEIQSRRNALAKIVEKLDIIARQDSLQRIAAMSPQDRDVYIKKLLKKMRRDKGEKVDDSAVDDGRVISFDKDKPVDLFAADTKGDWYFYNSSLKSKGLREFKSKWGTRANVDNWRRKSAIANILNPPASAPPEFLGGSNPDEPMPVDDKKAQASTSSAVADPIVELSYDGLMSNVPLSEEKLAASNAKLSNAMFTVAQLYQNLLEDYQQAINAYDSSLQRYPDSLYNGELYLGLYYCYNKLGNTAKADYYKNLLANKFPDSRSLQQATNKVTADPTVKNPEATKRYENIYNLFIEGKFDEALAEKKIADSLHGNNYWTPQLLYIEAVYHIKQKQDSAATTILDTIIQLYPTSKLAAKAATMKDVLSRRAEIEAYLTKLEVTRAKEDEVVKIDEPAPQRQVVMTDTIAKVADTVKKVAPPVVKDSIKTTAPVVVVPPVKDTVKKVIPKTVTIGDYTFDVTTPYRVIMILDKVDGTYINEAKNAFNRFNGERGYRTITISRDLLDLDKGLLVFTSFDNADAAMQYYAAIKKAAPDEVSWLPADKYTFLIIDDANLKVLKDKKDVAAYKKALNAQYPGKF